VTKCEFKPTPRTWQGYFYGDNATVLLPIGSSPWLNASDPVVAKSMWDFVDGLPVAGEMGEETPISWLVLRSFQCFVYLLVIAPTFEVIWNGISRAVRSLGAPQSGCFEFFEYYQSCGFVRCCRILQSSLYVLAIVFSIITCAASTFPSREPWGYAESCSEWRALASQVLSILMVSIAIAYGGLAAMGEPLSLNDFPELFEYGLFYGGCVHVSIKRQRAIEQSATM